MLFLILISIIIGYLLQKIFNKGLILSQKAYGLIDRECKSLDIKNAGLKKENLGMQALLGETIALYDITKDMGKALDENELFNIFNERLNLYAKVTDCKYIKEKESLGAYQNYKIFPLIIEEQHIGYLVADGVEPQDDDKFNILVQQFFLGMKRVLLYKRIQELSIIDSLTQIFNRRYFLQRLEEEIQRSRKFGYKFSFVMIDIDRFKDYNDRYGHLVGDAILGEVSKAIKENIRQIDFLGRYGGEEFALILTETDEEQAKFAVERIRKAVEDRVIKAYDENLKVTISLGISVFPKDAQARQSIIEKADKAMYKAKQSGRNRCFVYGEINDAR